MTAADKKFAEIRGTVEKCLRAALPPETLLPAEDDDWIESGLLDSMAHVDLLLAIETALNVPKLFGRIGVPSPTTLLAAVETISNSLAASPQTNIQESRTLLPAGALSSAGLLGWGSALGSNRIPIHHVEQDFHLSSPALAKSAGIVSICRASAGVVAPDARARLDPNLGFSGACFRTGGIVRCDDVENDPRVNLQACRRLGTRSMVAVPLCSQHSVIGLLEAFSCDAYAFNDSDVRSLNLLAELILAALKPEEPEQDHRLNDAPVNPPTIETSEPVELAQPLEPVMEAISDTQAKDYEAEHGEASEPALFGEYEKTEPSRPGLLVVTIVVIFAALFAGTLGWKIRSKTQAATKPAVTEQAKIPASVMLPAANSNQVSVQSPDGTGAQIMLPTEAGPAEALRGKFSVLPQVTGVRHWSSSDASTVAIDLQDPVQYEAHRLSSPERIYFDLHDTTLASGLSGKIIEVGDTLLVRVRIAQPMAGVTRVVLETRGASNFSVSLEPNPYRLVVQVRGMESSQSQTNKKIDLFPSVGQPEKNKGALAAGVVANGKNTQLRAHVSKFRIVLDAGHGGWDLGTVGRRGLLEKDVVLEIVQRLGRLLEGRLGSEVVYTRNNDNYVTLDQRTHLANQTQADMFVSIHANYSDLSSARGVETYYTDFFSPPGSREIEIARAAFGKIDVAHGFERHTNQQMKMRALRLDERLDGNVVGNVVSRCATRQKQERRCEE